MSDDQVANLAVSVHHRLLNLRQEKGEDFNLLLKRYTLERLLYRLSRSKHSDQFVLKGAMLFVVWGQNLRRPTRDLDLLGYGNSSPEELLGLFRQICRLDVAPDGLEFDADSINIAEIREGQEYQGQRVRLTAKLGAARISVQIDIAFGDTIVPEAEVIDYPTLLDFPSPHIRVYPKETVVSEKLQAIVSLGMANSRMKDFYDIYFLSREFPFDGLVLIKAISSTFERRQTQIPSNIPLALSDEFAMDRNKATQWKAFLKRSGLDNAEKEFSRVIDELRNFLLPPLFASAQVDIFKKSWTAGGPWV
jgi:predicted nucleotidyltransferase component of viral defense system